MITLLIWTANISAVVLMFLTEEFARLDRKRAARARIPQWQREAAAAFAKMTRGFQNLRGAANSPAMRRLRQRMERFVNLRHTGRDETNMERALREANEYRKGGLDHVHVVDARNYAPIIGIDYDEVDWS